VLTRTRSDYVWCYTKFGVNYGVKPELTLDFGVNSGVTPKV